jgi:predicted ATPase/DNA-binding XRE family transcriptional regulator
MTTRESAFGALLKRRREALKLTQQQLGQQIGCSAITIRKLESGERRPSEQVAELLAKHLKVPTEERNEFLVLARAKPAAVPSGSGDQAQTPSNNLPSGLASLVGRDAFISAALRHIRQDEARLFTLTGPGGVGKTSLALEIARQVVEVNESFDPPFHDGVYFVNLAPIGDADRVLDAIAQTLQVKDAGSNGPHDAVKAFLRDKRLLLILDNFEHVVAAAPHVAGVLAVCPHVVAMVTSRSRLRVAGERMLQVQPLAREAAVALFVERARAAKPEFRPADDGGEAIAEICHRLDGLPLAIELVAARIQLMSPRALLARLITEQGHTQIRMVADGVSDLPARHKTLHDTIRWSYDLLRPDEQALFRRLGVFMGGWTLEAAESVAAADNGQANAHHQSSIITVWNSLTMLLDNSLVQQHDQPDDEPRFSMLETLREFALEQLVASGEARVARHRHAQFFIALAERAEPHLAGSPEQKTWLNRLDRDHDNIRTALRLLLNEGRADDAARLASAIWRLWRLRGYLAEGRQWLEGAIAIQPQQPETQEQAAGQAKLLHSLGAIVWQENDLATARRCFERSLALARASGSKNVLWRALDGLAAVSVDLGEWDTAEAWISEGLSVVRDLGDQRGIANAIERLATIAYHRQDYRKAREWFEQSLAISRALSDESSICITLANLGSIAHALHQFDDSAAFLEESLALAHKLDLKSLIPQINENLIELKLEQGDYEQAQARCVEALRMSHEQGQRYTVSSCLMHLATVTARQRQPERAAMLLGASQMILEATGGPRQPGQQADFERLLAETRAQLDETLIDKAFARGKAMTAEQAVDFALNG